MKLISKIAYIHSEIQELVHESKLTALNKLLDESTNLYGELIVKLELTCKGRANSINEMSNIIAELQNTNAELEKERGIRDLEQQAKGLIEGFHATKEPIGRNAFGFMMHYCSEKNLKDKVDDLRNQSKALKDTK